MQQEACGAWRARGAVPGRPTRKRVRGFPPALCCPWTDCRLEAAKDRAAWWEDTASSAGISWRDLPSNGTARVLGEHSINVAARRTQIAGSFFQVSHGGARPNRHGNAGEN